MTPTTMTHEDFKGLGAPDLVYVRAITVADLMSDIPTTHIEGRRVDPATPLYAVHGADGARLAVMLDRDAAFAAALAHELEPVSVH